MPVVAATAAFSGLRPVAKAFGWSLADDVDLGHRQAGALRQAADHVVELGRAGPGHRLGIVHAERHLVGVPVGEGVGADREEERDQHAAGAADQVAHAHEERGQRREQQHRPEEVHAPSAPLRRPDGAAYDRRRRASGGIYVTGAERKRGAPRRSGAARALAEAEARRAAAAARRPARASSAAATARSRCASATGSGAASRSTSDGRRPAAVKQVICISWGTKYGAPYVNRLYAMVARNLTPPFSFTCFTDNAEGFRPGDPGRAAAAARCGDADRHQGDLAEGAALERRARRSRRGRCCSWTSTSSWSGSLDDFFSYGDAGRGDPGAQPQHAAGAARARPRSSASRSASCCRCRRSSSPTRRASPTPTSSSSASSPARRRAASRSGPSPGCGTSACTARGRCRSTSSCRRGCRTDARVVIFPGGLLPPHAIAGQWGGRYRPRTPGEHLRGLFAADRPDPPLRYLRHYLRPAPWVAEAWREGYECPAAPSCFGVPRSRVLRARTHKRSCPGRICAPQAVAERAAAGNRRSCNVVSIQKRSAAVGAGAGALTEEDDF